MKKVDLNLRWEGTRRIEGLEMDYVERIIEIVAEGELPREYRILRPEFVELG